MKIFTKFDIKNLIVETYLILKERVSIKIIISFYRDRGRG